MRELQREALKRNNSGISRDRKRPREESKQKAQRHGSREAGKASRFVLEVEERRRRGKIASGGRRKGDWRV